MKQLLITACILCSVQFLLGQCENSLSNLQTIDNYYRVAPIRPGGLVWEESFFLEGTQKEYSSSFANNLWVGGVTPGGNLQLGFNSYGSREPGPLRDSDAEIFENACDYFDRTWTLSGYDIKIHKDNYVQGNLNEDNIPKDILEWPAIGNVHFDIGEENGNTLNQNLAPFFDTNEDGVYNAVDGDIPIFKAGIEFENFEDVWAPYISALNIINDGYSGEAFNGERLSYEILQSTYMLNCADNQELNYSIFYNLNLVYKGNNDLNELRVGYWEDVDFGCYDNDYIGCKPSLNTAFAYNEDPIESFCQGGVVPIELGWGMSKNTILLSHDMSSFIAYNNSNVGIPPAATVDPQNAFQVYNLLGGTWLDGSPITDGGNGFNPGSVDETLFIFPDLPNDPSGWSMASNGIATNDLRTVMGINTQESISPGDQIVIEIASHVLYDPFTSHLGIFDKLEDGINVVKDAYNTIQTNPQDLDECSIAQSCTEDCVWPGNILPDDRVDGKDVLLYGAILGKGILDGKDRDQRGGLWAPHTADNWNDDVNGTNAKHADCNGDGMLLENDIDIFINNFDLNISNPDSFQDDIATFDPEGFKITLDKTEIDVVNSSIIGRVINVSIGPRELESFDFSYHGLSFDIVFDTSKISKASLFGFDINEEFFDESIFAEGFYDEQDTEPVALRSFGDNRISVMATSGNGENQFPDALVVTNVGLYAFEGGTTNNMDGRDTTQIRLENIVFMDADGQILDEDVGYYTTDLILTGLEFAPEIVSVVDEDLNSSFKVIPNPASTKINIQSEIPIDGIISIVNLDGTIIQRHIARGAKENYFDISKLSAGVYMIQIKDNKRKLLGVERFVVIK